MSLIAGSPPCTKAFPAEQKLNAEVEEATMTIDVAPSVDLMDRLMWSVCDIWIA